MNEIRIEVSAEDGTVKNYFIRIKRLSASDASLVSLSSSAGKLDPPFAIDCDQYTCKLEITFMEHTLNKKLKFKISQNALMLASVVCSAAFIQLYSIEK